MKTIATGASSFLLLYCLGCGSSTQQATTQQPATTPNISQVTPQTIPAGSQSMTLKVTGTNFPAQAAILWNGAAVSTTVIDANTLSGTIGSSSLANPATVQLQVQNTQTMQASQAVPVVITPTNTGGGSSTPSLVISTTSLPQGGVSSPYAVTLNATGGTSPYTWSVTSGQLPAGLNLAANTGILSGTPTASGNYSFSVTAFDASSPAQQSTTTALTLSIAAGPVTPTPLTVNTASLPTGTIESAYSTLLQASGGTAPYSWSFVSGNLPAGLSLNTTTGLISGTPTAPGTANFTVAAADSANPAQSKSANLSIVIAPVSLAITTSSFPSGTVGTPYSTLLQASGGTAPYTWSISSGSLPAGFSLSTATGIISGTPTTSGTASFTATVVDAGSPAQTKSVVLSLVIAPSTLWIASSSLPSGTQSSSYSNVLQASGGTAPYTWSLTSGALPAGLTLDPGGLIHGTPTASSSNTPFSFGVTVKDAGSPAQTASGTITLSIVAAGTPLAISTTSLPGGTPNQPYSATLNATGGTAPYSWTIANGSLPAGISFKNGVISGTPTAGSTSNLTFTVTDSSSSVQTKSATLSLVVTAPLLTFSTSSLPSGTNGTSYSTLLQASGGTTPYAWTITAGSLPKGLSLASATGLISGTPTATGTASFTVTVTDGGSPAQSQSAKLSIVVAAPPPTPLTISTSSLPAGTKGTSYSNALQAGGGTTPYAWSVVAGSLPAGLSLAPATGLISGTPTATGTASFTVLVTDGGSPAQTQSVKLSIAIAAPAPPPLTISTSSLPAGTKDSSYSNTLQASGGTTPYAWSVTTGSLPAGLSLASATGLISGTPTATGTTSFTVTVTDGGSPAQTQSAKLSIVVAAAAPSTLTISTSSLPSGTKGTSYSNTLQASGGTTPYAWSVTTGSLPAGLSLASSTGLISGTPTATGTTSFTVTVTDGGSPAQTQSAKLSIVVAAATSSLTIGATLPSGTIGTAYSSPMTATGGTPAYTWSITAGTLPAGLTLAATSGTISGTPTATGTFNFTATVADNSNPALTQSAQTSIVVAAASAPPGPGTTWYIRPDGGTRYSANATTGQCDGQADVAYSGSGTNQHCAFNDYRYLYDDGSWQNSAWVIAGGDTVIIRGGPYRVGVNQGASPSDVWCNGTGNPYGCTNPAFPAGTATQHTRILGENYGSCSTSNMTQLYGGFGLFNVINLSGAQFVDVQCIELTRHSQCIRIGVPAVPSYCSSSFPVDDYASNGITTNTNTHDVLLQDMWIHGFTSRGIIGPIGGTVTATRVDIAYNGGAGWDFDDGNSTANVNGVLNLSYVTIEWNGCNQLYPGTGAISCYSQSTGGYGDGIGTPEATCLTAHVDHSTFRYNTQDGYDMLHNDAGNCSMSITDSTSYGNNGAQFKWGPNDNPMVFTNNTAIANCMRLSAPMQGQPSTYNANLADFCRASDAIAFGLRDGGTLLMANNTIVTYAPTTLDATCSGTYPQGQGQGTCANSTFTFENNIVYGVDNPNTYSVGGQQGGPGVFYYGTPLGHVIRSNNVYYGFRSTSFVCPTGITGEVCADPLFVNEPVFTGESSWDNFNFKITPGSPAAGAGLYIPSVPLDYSGVSRPNPPSIGVLEP